MRRSLYTPSPRGDGEWFLLLMLACGLAWLLTGCSNLREKSVAAAGTVSAVKIETSGSASTGTPTPSILMGGAAYAFADSPAGANQPVFVRAARKSFISQLFNLGTDDSVVIYIGTSNESSVETVTRIKVFMEGDQTK
jgi:hypothetical protein